MEAGASSVWLPARPGQCGFPRPAGSHKLKSRLPFEERLMSVQIQGAKRGASGLTTGQAALVAGLIDFFEVGRNPLQTLLHDVYPAYLLSFPARARRRYGEPAADPPSPLARLNDWARKSQFIASNGRGTAEWIVNWAAHEFPLDPRWPHVRRDTPWWRRLNSPVRDSDVRASSLGDLSAPEPIPTQVVVEIPAGATRKKAISLFLAKWAEARGMGIFIAPGQPGQPGRPKNSDYAKYLALALCGWNRLRISKRFQTNEHEVTVGIGRAARNAGISYRFKRQVTKPT